MKKLLFVLAVCLVVSGMAQAATWDLATDWPATLGNGTLPLPSENGAWTYGYGTQASYDPLTNVVAYTFNKWNATAASQWGLMNNGIYLSTAAPNPFIGCNRGNSWPGADLPVGSIGGHDGGVRTMFRWTAPASGYYEITTKSWIAYIEGGGEGNPYPRDIWFGVAKDGSNPVAVGHAEWVYGNGLQSANKTVATAIVWVNQGENLDYFEFHLNTGGMAGYDFTITEVPEPGSMLALGSGLFGLLGFAWRKRG